MTTELGLRINGPTISDTDIASLAVAIVLSGRVWVTARELAEFYDDRTLRAIAAASDGRIISGQRGYALMAECTPDEIDHAATRLESQAREMFRRAVAIRRRAHRVVG